MTEEYTDKDFLICIGNIDIEVNFAISNEKDWKELKKELEESITKIIDNKILNNEYNKIIDIDFSEVKLIEEDNDNHCY